MPHRVVLLAALILIVPLVSVAAGDRPKEQTIEQVLAELKKQTGNTVEDRRTHPSNAKLTLPRNAGFWQSLDAIGEQTGVGFSAYQPDGSVALVDKPYRKLMTHYDGPFRFTVKRISVSRDDETQAHTCKLTLDAAWEPRLAMLYLNVSQATAAIGKKKEQLERQTPRSVAGTSAAEIELRLQAPPRNVARIDALTGELNVIGAPKMLEFKFANLAAGQKAEQEGVKASLADARQNPLLWSFDIVTEYPKGALVELESYQSWMDNNRVWLAWTDAKTKRTYEIEPTGESPQNTPTGTRIRYYFSVQGKSALPPRGVEVELRYRTPSRVIAFTAPFSFRDLPLP
jgi:hypothetical protein